jgi:hypothetical protein
MIRDCITESLGLVASERSLPSKGKRPQTIANSITPNAQTSKGGPMNEILIYLYILIYQ